MDRAVQVGEGDTIALSVELRAQYDIQPGDTFRLLDLDGIFKRHRWYL